MGLSRDSSIQSLLDLLEANICPRCQGKFWAILIGHHGTNLGAYQVADGFRCPACLGWEPQASTQECK